MRFEWSKEPQISHTNAARKLSRATIPRKTLVLYMSHLRKDIIMVVF